ncbi:C-reactive protein-like protein [Lates japonicus]|uniref:C-reactive protein-like protein n=1 Tax=Lates japonicus TaxID=270547 RepID=A0AAD3N177_LATJO|nr:C-reactive protein-like protein [Lates japonicus]
MMFLLALTMLAACAASPQDLSGKMFTFPQETNRAHVRLNTTMQDFSSVTVCHRSFTDLRRSHGLFSLATPSSNNEFLIFWSEANKEMQPHIKEGKFRIWRLWFDGQPSIRKFITSRSNIRGSLIIILGQEQDSHGGGFDIKQSFVGMMTDVHMWDYVLSPCEIHNYVDELNFTPGNVLNWRALGFQIIDRVLIEDKFKTCH